MTIRTDGGDQMSQPEELTTTAAADALIPAGHPFAAHPLRAAAAGEHRHWTPEDGRLPSLYLSPGAPIRFEMTDWMTQLHAWARALPKPRAIVIAPAHWEPAPISISTSRPTVLGYG